MDEEIILEEHDIMGDKRAGLWRMENNRQYCLEMRASATKMTVFITSIHAMNHMLLVLLSSLSYILIGSAARTVLHRSYDPHLSTTLYSFCKAYRFAVNEWVMMCEWESKVYLHVRPTLQEVHDMVWFARRCATSQRFQRHSLDMCRFCSAVQRYKTVSIWSQSKWTKQGMISFVLFNVHIFFTRQHEHYVFHGRCDQQGRSGMFVTEYIYSLQSGIGEILNKYISTLWSQFLTTSKISSL